MYIPGVEEVAASFVMSKALSEIPGAPSDASAFEEAGYGIPEYSLYYGPDVRSYSGAWYWTLGKEPEWTICSYVTSERACSKLKDIIERLEKKARSKGRYVFFAVWSK